MKKFKSISKYIFLITIIIQFAGCFLLQSVNEVFSRFTSLMSFFVLGLLCLAKLIDNTEKPNIKDLITKAFHDWEFCLVIVGMIIAALNLFIINSNKGAFLTAADVLMAFYVSDDFFLEKKKISAICFSASMLLIWWYCTVRWEYNFNTVGIIFMITAIMTLILLEALWEDYAQLYYLKYVQLILYITATLLCLLYHARCVLIGMLEFGVLFLLLPFIARKSLFRGVLVACVTAGSLLFSNLYILLAKTGVNITILYKNIISGRQKIWGELWENFVKMPLTGIGSSYEMKNFFIFEVHNGFLDILIVHGIFVFACVFVLAVRRLLKALRVFGEMDRSAFKKGYTAKRMALAGVFAVLFTSFFENFFINSPYLLMMLMFMGMIMSKDSNGK